MNTWHFRVPRIIRDSKSSAFLSNESPYSPGSRHLLFKPIHHLTRTGYAERRSPRPLSPLCDHWVCISQHFYCVARRQLAIKGAATDASAVSYKHQKWLHKNTTASSSSTDWDLPTTLGSFCRLSGIRGSLVLILLNRPHKIRFAFLLLEEL